MTNKVTPALLREVALDNIRTHQLGGQTDGISWDVAHEMGFTAPDEVDALPITTPEPVVTGDPELDADWHAEQAAFPDRIKQLGLHVGKLTSKQMMDNEARHIAHARSLRLGR